MISIRVSPEVPVPESSGVFLVPVSVLGTGTEIGSGSGPGLQIGPGQTGTFLHP